jgi:protein-disulfide isomerase
MANKKIVIFGIIALAALVGIIWYGSQRNPAIGEQAAALLKGGLFSEEESFQLVDDEFILGSPDAPVTIIEYSSHFCGHCVNFYQETLPLIMEKYIKTGQAKLIPRRLSPSELGQTLLCAQEQDKFQTTDDYLFEHVSELLQQTSQAASEDELNTIVANWLKAAAKDLGLDQTSFNRCFDSGKYHQQVVKWFEQAEADGVEGTPTFLINGQLIVGNQPYNVFEEVIEQTLAQ